MHDGVIGAPRDRRVRPAPRPGTARFRREEPNAHRFSGTCGRGFDQRLRVVCAAAIDNNDVVKAEPGGDDERHVDDAGFVQRGNDHRESHGEGRSARRCWLANTYPDFFGSLNMKYMTINTVAQKTTCLCQNKTSP